MMNRMITTTFARRPICFQSEIGSQPTELSSKSQAAKRWKLQSATAARFTTMSCFPPQNCFELVSNRFLNSFFPCRDGTCPVSIWAGDAANRVSTGNQGPGTFPKPARIKTRGLIYRLMQENQSVQNCPPCQNHPASPSRE